jgi:flavin reductase (DIM6/NTAB) family NADH-FMN oxidoreductase RutF
MGNEGQAVRNTNTKSVAPALTRADDEHPGSHAAPVKATAGELFDSRDFRSALGTFGTGVTIITARGQDGGLYGMTANSFTSVSLTPPLVLWSASLYAQSLPAFQEGSHFVVNILAYDQIDLSNKFARTHENKFAEIDHIIPECGAPVLIGAAAHVFAATEQ